MVAAGEWDEAGAGDLRGEDAALFGGRWGGLMRT
jgi:hypothetical protein